MPKVNSSTLRQLLHFQFTHGKIESHCVADVSYNPETEQMTIAFQQRGTYVYSNVPIDDYVDFASAGSQGTYFNLYIRPKYTSYERVA
jgi:KTSC domain-containing protein